MQRIYILLYDTIQPPKIADRQTRPPEKSRKIQVQNQNIEVLTYDDFKVFEVNIFQNISEKHDEAEFRCRSTSRTRSNLAVDLVRDENQNIKTTSDQQIIRKQQPQPQNNETRQSTSTRHLLRHATNIIYS